MHSSLPNLFKNNKYITSDKDKANKFLNSFNKAFTAGDGLLGNILGLAYCQPTDIPPDFSPASVQKHLKSINSQSTAGPDGFPGIFWNFLHNFLSLPLSIIFVKSFSSGCLPSIWKHSVISPVFKNEILPWPQIIQTDIININCI